MKVMKNTMNPFSVVQGEELAMRMAKLMADQAESVAPILKEDRVASMILPLFQNPSFFAFGFRIVAPETTIAGLSLLAANGDRDSAIVVENIQSRGYKEKSALREEQRVNEQLTFKWRVRVAGVFVVGMLLGLLLADLF